MKEFEQIYEKHFRYIYLYIKKMSGDEHIAEEIVSDTFFKALKSIDSFRGDCDIRVWLCKIAKNQYINYVKKQKLHSVYDDDTLISIASDEDIQHDFANADEAEQIKTALHGIPEPYKEVFMWRTFAELSFKQIGNIFGKTDNRACVTYHRAVKMIRTKLKEEN